MSDNDLIRHKDIPGSVMLVQTSNPDPDTVFRDQNLEPIRQNFQIMVYQPPFQESYERRSANETGPKSKWKSFQHYKRSVDLSTGSLGTCPITFDAGNSQSYLNTGEVSGKFALCTSLFGERGKFDKDLPVFVNLSEPANFVAGPPHRTELINMAFKAMFPAVKKELSLINSIIELKDMKTLKGSIKHLLSLPSLIKTLNKPGTLRQILRAASDNYLQTKFNIQPLISDIRGIYRALANSEKRINELIARSGRVRTSHYTRPLVIDGTNSYQKIDVNFNMDTPQGNVDIAAPHLFGWEERIVVNTTPVFHAEMQYNYNYTAYQLEHARVLALLDALGVNFNPQIIWNAIPWSFVVDWVVDVGQWLDQFKVANMEPKINITQFLWSYKQERTIYVTSSLSCAAHYVYDYKYGPANVVHPPITERSYTRVSGFGDIGSLTGSGLSPTEFSLGAALVLSRGRHHRTRRR
jgi:hypothetical protein